MMKIDRILWSGWLLLGIFLTVGCGPATGTRSLGDPDDPEVFEDGVTDQPVNPGG